MYTGIGTVDDIRPKAVVRIIVSEVNDFLICIIIIQEWINGGGWVISIFRKYFRVSIMLTVYG